ncbi:MAG: sigma-70 family RNA polymerase sigma factor [Polyangiaceae bacterium]|jgi:RNA polymerase sigma-70 factor (ECF subfamily)
MTNEEQAEVLAEARRGFKAACLALRPDLHRFCTRMTGSPCDGEDVLQEALVLAFYRLDELRQGASFKAWLFRIAHNKCIDFLRSRKARLHLEEANNAEERHAMDEVLDRKQRVERALASIVSELPAKERACVVLKGVLDWSLEETAAITGSSIGAVKSALHRGRARLERVDTESPANTLDFEPRQRELIERYLAAFNNRDWDAVSALVADEARLEVVDRSEGPFRDIPYFSNYGKLPWRWKFALARVDGVESVVLFRETGETWVPRSILLLDISDDKIAAIRDYVHVDYLLHHCVVVEGPSALGSHPPPTETTS